MSFLAKNILFLRKKLKLTQAEMPVRIDVGRATWSNYENGHSEPEIDKIIGIAEYFGVSIDDLLTVDIGANVHLNGKDGEGKNGKNVHLNVHANVLDTQNSLVEEEETPLLKPEKEQVNWLILQGVNALGEDMAKLKQKLGI